MGNGKYVFLQIFLAAFLPTNLFAAVFFCPFPVFDSFYGEYKVIESTVYRENLCTANGFDFFFVKQTTFAFHGNLVN